MRIEGRETALLKGEAVELHENIVEVTKSLIPVRMEVLWGTITGVTGTMITYLFGQWNDALSALALFIFIDYVTGMMAAYLKPRSRWSSKKGLRGIIKKLALVTFVAFGHGLDMALGQNVFCVLVTYTILGNEGLSIVENLSCCGVPVPASIKSKLEQLSQEKSGRDGGK